MQALKARDSRAQGEAAKQLKPWVRGRKGTKPCKGETTGCFALAGLLAISADPQGSGAARLHPGLSCSALSAL
jgi:hypothetical protein